MNCRLCGSKKWFCLVIFLHLCPLWGGILPAPCNRLQRTPLLLQSSALTTACILKACTIENLPFQPIYEEITWILTISQFSVVCTSVFLLPFGPWAPVLGGHFSDVSVFMSQVTLLIAFICVRSAPWTGYSAYRYFEVVTICNLIMILAFYLVHLFRVYRMLTCISWPLSVREWPGPFLSTEVMLFAGALRPHGVLPVCPPQLLHYPLLFQSHCLVDISASCPTAF